MTRDEALTAIAAQLGLKAKELIRHANRDDLGGDDNKMGSWINGISWAVEGQILYALVRSLKPERILEIGTNYGGSATHMGMGCYDNKIGHITSIDINAASGSHIPDQLREWITVVIEDANLYVVKPEVKDFDFIFEDGNHSKHQVHVIYENLHKLLKPGGIIISHDAAVEGVGEYIRYGIEAAGHPYPPMYVVEPSPCGFTVMRRNTL